MNKPGKLLAFKILLLGLLFPYTLSNAIDKEQPGNKEQLKEKSTYAVFSVHDTNQDGFLSQKEYLAFLEKYKLKKNRKCNKPDRKHEPLLFEAIDTDKDLKLSEDEIIAAISKQRQQHKRYRHRYRGGRM